ncbi:hypothetical protein [Xanthomonas arboricola]|uniref:hypothetical protein n=1 Tax=Xanthomonas arboricola TaxID=56448 RepID=UPI002018AF71|nr:hypothetical protein [Xanthomonas arboricola]UQQ14985.1 hypothetical protein KPG65_00150 [Xanthomonas arboricola pv. corylina]
MISLSLALVDLLLLVASTPHPMHATAEVSRRGVAQIETALKSFLGSPKQEAPGIQGFFSIDFPDGYSEYFGHFSSG